MSSSFESTKKILNQHQSKQNENEWVLLSLDHQSSTLPIPIAQSVRTSVDDNTQTQAHKGWIKNTGTIPFWLKWMYLNQMSSCRSN